MVEEAINDHLTTQGIQCLVDSGKYKLTFTLNTVDQGGQQHNIEICIKLLQVQQDLVCI